MVQEISNSNDIPIDEGHGGDDDDDAEWSNRALTRGTQSMIEPRTSSLYFTSAWVQPDETAPMMTHCHLLLTRHQSRPRPRHRTGDEEEDTSTNNYPIRRVRSRSFNDRFDDDLEEEWKRSYNDLQQLHQQQDEQQAAEIDNSAKSVRQSTTTYQKQEEEGNPIYLSILYGLINSCVVLPVMMSFGSIIYQDDFFDPYMPVLIKLTLFSSVVHQLCFATFSSLPFAVGQVQDAGLIFLSTIASGIVQYCKDHGHEDDPGTILATVTIGLGVATALLGVGLVVVGKVLRLAQYVQMLPTPVVGGYLAFIGWFCGVAGLRLMMVPDDNNKEPTSILQQSIFLLPGIVGGCLIYGLVRNLRHMAVLPTCVLVLILSFYGGLFLTGRTVEDATTHGWIRKADPAPVWYETWGYFQFEKVVWSALVPQTGTLLAMIFVVSISSSLDVAAIELDYQTPLDFNQELSMVGVSNVISGLTGGYTGSYIFSQTIFNLRAGIRSRLCGYCIAVAELAIFLIPFPLLSYVPNFFFGSLLVMIAVDLMVEWLWEVRTKLSTPSYGVCVATFAFIQCSSVQAGIVAGIILFALGRKVGLDLDGLSSQDGDSRSTEEEENSLLEEQNDQYGATESPPSW